MIKLILKNVDLNSIVDLFLECLHIEPGPPFQSKKGDSVLRNTAFSSGYIFIGKQFNVSKNIGVEKFMHFKDFY